MNTKIINIYNMWLQVIDEFRKNNKQILDLKFELHLAIYVQAILNDNISFHLNNDDIQIKKKEDNINLNQFYYWWSIERFNEILSEEALAKHKSIWQMSDIELQSSIIF